MSFEYKNAHEVTLFAEVLAIEVTNTKVFTDPAPHVDEIEFSSKGSKLYSAIKELQAKAWEEGRKVGSWDGASGEEKNPYGN